MPDSLLALVGLALAIRPLDGVACALAHAVGPLADGPRALAVGPLALALAVGLPHYYYN